MTWSVFVCFCCTQVKYVPFNPTDKYTIATIRPKGGGPPFRLMKGAPQVQAYPTENSMLSVNPSQRQMRPWVGNFRCAGA